MNYIETNKINWKVYCNKEKQEIEAIPFIYLNEETELLDLNTNNVMDVEMLDNNDILKQYKSDIKGFEPLSYLNNGPVWETHHLLNYCKSKVGLKGKEETEIYKEYIRKFNVTIKDIEKIKNFTEEVNARFIKYKVNRNKHNILKNSKDDLSR